MWERRAVCKVLVGKPEDKRPLGEPTRIQEDNIKMYIKDAEQEGVDQICLAFLNAVMHLVIP